MPIKTVHGQSREYVPLSISEKPWSSRGLLVTIRKTLSPYEADIRDKIFSIESSKDDSSCDSGYCLWDMMYKHLEHEESNAQFWWTATGSLLAILLHQAKYQIMAQCEILQFYFSILIPELGPSPDSSGRFPQWKSFMTDENMPIELSWEWGLGDSPPTVRLSIEPIGLDVGTPQNSLNEFVTNQLVENIKRIFPGIDLRLFHHFSKELLTYNLEDQNNDTTLGTASHQTRSFLAFDFGKTGTMLKAYFFPVFKATETGQSTLALISQGLASLEKLEGIEFPGYDFLSDHIRTSPEGSRLEVEMFAIDCISPASSRMKVYLRSQSTSFESVRANMTLDGRLKHQGLDKGVVELEKLWKLVLLPAQNIKADEELPRKAHRTAGILYYYDIKPNELVPTPRIYIPVRHYGQNDTAISEGLVCYLKTRGQDEISDRYLRALRDA